MGDESLGINASGDSRPFMPREEMAALRESLRDWCRDWWDEAALRGFVGHAETLSGGTGTTTDLTAMWRALAADLDTVGLGVSEEWGGSGAGLAEMAIVAEELGRALVPLPWLPTAALAAAAAAIGGTTAHEIVRAILETPARCAVAEVDVLASAADGEGWSLTGRASHVAHARQADVLAFLPADDDGGLFVVDAGAPGMTISPEPTLDLTRAQATVQLDGVSARRIGSAGRGAGEVLRAVGAVLVAAESVGVAARMLDMSIEHARTRHQFGRPIGTFQAVKHRCVDMRIELEHARSAVEYAGWTHLGGGGEAMLSASLAHQVATAAAREITAAAIQVHGGMGVTWEHPAHLYYKRSLVNAWSWGGLAHRETFAGLFLTTSGAGQEL